MLSSVSKKYCRCGEEIEPQRLAIGKFICLDCGEEQARKQVRCIVPLHKSSYILITDKKQLKELDPKYKI